MKIQKALEIANDCDLETIGEAIYNIKIHAGNLFGYDDAKKELEELNNTWAWTKEHRKTPDGKYHIDENTKVQVMLQYHIAEDLIDFDIYNRALKDEAFAKQLAEE